MDDTQDDDWEGKSGCITPKKIILALLAWAFMLSLGAAAAGWWWADQTGLLGTGLETRAPTARIRARRRRRSRRVPGRSRRTKGT
jgi:hypothetical protein